MGNRVIKASLLLIVLAAASACEGNREKLELLSSGPPHELNGPRIQAHTASEVAAIKAISERAGFTKEPTTPDEWRQFVIAGIQYADTQCESYMKALFWFERAKSRASNQVNLVGTAAVGIMGILGAASEAIAITAVAFGLTQSTIDNIGSGLLYELEPSSVRDLVRKLQATYEANLPASGYRDRASAYRALHGYVVICLPQSIETQVKNAIKSAKEEAVPGDAVKGTPPIVQIGPISSVTYGVDSSTDILRKFWKPDGKNVSPENQQRLLEFLAGTGLKERSIPELLYAGEFASARAQAVIKLKLKE